MFPTNRAAVVCLYLLTVTFGLLGASGAGAFADASLSQATPAVMPFLHPLFADNMVLQRDADDRIWGWTTPGATVTVSLDGKTATAVAGADGKWLATIGRFKAGGPYQLTVSGPQSVTLNNVMIGDVWLCSGQSNMEFGVAGAIGGPADVAAADLPDIRLFRVAHVTAGTPQPLVAPTTNEPFAAQWQVCSPKTVGTGGWGGFTAVGFYFGRDLYNRLHVPIGLIADPWSGMPAESFVSAGSLSRMPDFQDPVRAVQAAASGTFSDTAYADRVDRWAAAYDPGSAGAQPFSAPALDDGSWPTMKLPGAWAKQAAQLAGFDGIVWYRTTIDAPAAWAGKSLTIQLGPIADVDTVWIDGVRVGSMGYWTTTRSYAIPPGVVKTGTNIIAVRVIDNGGNGGLWGKPDQMNIGVAGDPSTAISLAKDWKWKATIPWTAALPAPPVTAELKSPSTPTVLFNGMVSPLTPLAIKGAIWYQGESNASRAQQYRTLLPTLIEDWRTQFENPDMPFLVVQLAAFNPYGANPNTLEWAELREAQMLTAQTMKNVGLAVTIDIGNATDIHPKDKLDVGKRLAMAAWHIAYNHRDEYWGPTYRSMSIEGTTVRVKFDHVAGGLKMTGDKLTGFTMAGDDHKFVPVDAALDGRDTVVLTVPPAIAKPVDVRYAFESDPTVDLYNGIGLPAVPFRTDVSP